MLPIIIAQLVVLLKDTALAYIIGYDELLRLVSKLSNFYGNQYRLSVFLVVLVDLPRHEPAAVVGGAHRRAAHRARRGYAPHPEARRHLPAPQGDVNMAKVPDAGSAGRLRR